MHLYIEEEIFQELLECLTQELIKDELMKRSHNGRSVMSLRKSMLLSNQKFQNQTPG
jgi:hypothetical protein